MLRCGKRYQVRSKSVEKKDIYTPSWVRDHRIILTDLGDTPRRLSAARTPEERDAIFRNFVQRSLVREIDSFVERMAGQDFSLEDFNKIVPSYDGGRVGLEKFVRFGDLYYGELNEVGKGIFDNYFGIKLTGRAYELYEDGEYDDWESFKGALLLKFEEKKSISILMSELMGVSQKVGESVRIFANRIDGLKSQLNHASKAIRVNNEAATEHFAVFHEQSALRAFQDGLREPLRMLMKARNYQSFGEAIQGALEEELYASREGASGGGEEMVRSRLPLRGSVRGIVCYRCNKEGHLSTQCTQGVEKGGFNSRISGGLSNVTCFRCQRRGHLSTQCTQNANQGMGSGRINDSRQCFRCGRTGHIGSNCFTRVEGREQRLDVSSRQGGNGNINNNYRGDATRGNPENVRNSGNPFRRQEGSNNNQGGANWQGNGAHIRVFSEGDQKNEEVMTTGMGTVAIDEY